MGLQSSNPQSFESQKLLNSCSAFSPEPLSNSDLSGNLRWEVNSLGPVGKTHDVPGGWLRALHSITLVAELFWLCVRRRTKQNQGALSA